MKILFIGDVFGKSGRKAIANEIPKLRKQHNIDVVIANAENCTHGRSINLRHYRHLKSCGVDYFTFGNHTWHCEEVFDILKLPNVVRPHNLKSTAMESKHGVGTIVFEINKKTIRLTNMLGSTVHCRDIQTNPFIALRKIIDGNAKTDIHIIDFHAETTSEKTALLLEFSGQVTAILGTHTHVQTADNRILNGTAFITDVGMTGGSEGVIGAEPETILKMFKKEVERFKLTPSKSKYQFCAVIIEIDDETNKAKKITRVFNYEK